MGSRVTVPFGGWVSFMLDTYPCLCRRKKSTVSAIYIQGVTGGTDQTSGGCSLC